MQVGERQRQPDHHQAGERVERALPELDLLLLRRLLVVGQMGDVAPELDASTSSSPAARRRRRRWATEMLCQSSLRQLCSSRADDALPASTQRVIDRVAQRPRAVAGRRRPRPPRSAHASRPSPSNSKMRTLRSRVAALGRADVDRVAALAAGPGRVLLDPRAGAAERTGPAGGAGVQLARDPLAERRDVIADDEGEQRRRRAPGWSSSQSARPGPRPPVRRIVYCDDCARRASA